jgi:hypothetical protein
MGAEIAAVHTPGLVERVTRSSDTAVLARERL